MFEFTFLCSENFFFFCRDPHQYSLSNELYPFICCKRPCDVVSVGVCVCVCMCACAHVSGDGPVLEEGERHGFTE